MSLISQPSPEANAARPPSPAQAAVLLELEALLAAAQALEHRCVRVWTIRRGSPVSAICRYLVLALGHCLEQYELSQRAGRSLDLAWAEHTFSDGQTRPVPILIMPRPPAKVIDLAARRRRG